MIKRVSLLVLIACAQSLGYAQQNMMMNQYMFAGIVLNPAYAGVHNYQEFHSFYRKQWLGMDKSPESHYLSIHGQWKGQLSAVGTGFSLQHDKIGTSTQTEASGMYSYKIRMGDGKLSFGLRAGLFVFNSQLTNEIVFEPNDPVFDQNVDNEPFLNFGSGVYYYTDKYYLGLASQRLLAYGMQTGYVNNADNRLFSERITNVYGGFVFDVTDGIKLKPNTLIKVSRASNPGIDLNMNMLFRDYFWLGLSHKLSQGAWAAIFHLEKLKPFRFGYAYDLRFVTQGGGLIGSHEMMISYDFGDRRKIVRDVKLF